MSARLPTVKDLKSDTVKSLGIIALIQLIDAVFGVLASFDVISSDILSKWGLASPYIIFILTYMAVFFRVNYKTPL